MRDGYRVVRFSPDPEEVEFINVALLVWEAPHSRPCLHLYEEFPRMNRLGTRFPSKFLADYLGMLRDLVSHGGAALSSQFQIMPFVEGPVGHRVPVLMKRLLS
jgi:hypothetical protein